MSRASPRYVVEPQRNDGAGFMPCLPQQAQRFACVALLRTRHNGKARTFRKTSGTYPTMRQAQAAADSLNTAATRSAKPTLGKRLTVRPGKVLFRSLTRAEYNAITQSN